MAAEHDNDDDGDLFRKEMEKQGVKTRRRSNRANFSQPPRSIERDQRSRHHSPAHSTHSENSSGSPDKAAAVVDQTFPGEPVLFVRAGNRKTTIRALRRGQIPLDETIDLHGMRETEAKRALTLFLQESKQFRWRCVQIIHGKGSNSDQPGGVLRPMTLHWLKQQPEVRAFCSADARSGGTGATNVLLSG